MSLGATEILVMLIESLTDIHQSNNDGADCYICPSCQAKVWENAKEFPHNSDCALERARRWMHGGY